MKIMKSYIIIIFMSAIIACQSYAGITLKSTDEYGRSTTTFNVGVPWTLEVSLEDMPDVKERPTIKGLDQVYARDSSMMTMSINGKTTIKYSYRVRFDAAGTYTVGPAMVERNGQILSSNAIMVRVVDQPADDGGAKDKNGPAVLFVRMKVDKDRVMVGEKFKCILRCYYTDQVSQAEPSSAMQLAGLVFEDGVQQANGVETLKGVNYNYFELCWNVYATEAGKRNIPAYSIDYITNTNRYGSHASAIAMMLGHSFGEKKRAYSNVVPITIEALPAHNGPVHAIGMFNRFASKIEPMVAKQGEGMVLTLELVGRGTFDKDHNIELQGMPPEFKYYDSKQYDDQKNGTTKYFEFIVQGLSVGDWQLPSQKFTFFDTKTRAYKTLETDVLRVKIIGNSVGKQAAASQLNARLQSNEVDMADDIKPMITKENIIGSNVPAFPGWVIIMLILIPAGLIGYETINSRTRFLDKINQRSAKNNAFIRARNEIKHIFAHQSVSSLYSVFTKLFATRCSVDEHVVNQEFIYDFLKKSGMHQQELEQWNQFYNQLNELMFFNKHINHNETLVLQQYADRWIDRLEKIL